MYIRLQINLSTENFMKYGYIVFTVYYLIISNKQAESAEFRNGILKKRIINELLEKRCVALLVHESTYFVSIGSAGRLL